MTNLPAQLSTLTKEIGVLADQLQPARSDFIAQCLTGLLASGMRIPDGINEDDFLSEYSFSLEGIPAFGLSRAVKKLKRGEIPDVNHDFMPRPAALAAIARNETKTVRDDLVRLREKQSTLELLKPKPAHNEEAKNRVRVMLAEFQAKHKADKERQYESRNNDFTQAPLADEQREYWKKIESFTDAKDLTVEQSQFRRRVAKRLHDEENGGQ